MHRTTLAPVLTRTLSPQERMLRSVLRGLERTPRTLPCKYFYDERGSQLFDQICELEEYYITRTELAIMRRHAGAMADAIGEDACLIEFGSGSGIKTRLLLEHLHSPAAYVPIDISAEPLAASAEQLRELHPELEIVPICGDFTQRIRPPRVSRRASRSVIYFPGSTIGNFGPRGAERLLKRMARLCGRGGGLLIGVDLKKSRAVLERAYDDARGVTRAFNLNLLAHINGELDADFDLAGFEHRAVYNEVAGRIEMHLVSLRPQCVAIGDTLIEFAPGEFIRTECSYKYEVSQFARLAARAGWRLRNVWCDEARLFSVQYLTVV